MAKKKITSDRVMIEFDSVEAAEAFYDYFRKWGFDEFTGADSVHDDIPMELIPTCISSEEEPMEGMDFYFLQVQ